MARWRRSLSVTVRLSTDTRHTPGELRHTRCLEVSRSRAPARGESSKELPKWVLGEGTLGGRGLHSPGTDPAPGDERKKKTYPLTLPRGQAAPSPPRTRSRASCPPLRPRRRRSPRRATLPLPNRLLPSPPPPRRATGGAARGAAASRRMAPVGWRASAAARSLHAPGNGARVVEQRRATPRRRRAERGAVVLEQGPHFAQRQPQQPRGRVVPVQRPHLCGHSSARGLRGRGARSETDCDGSATELQA